VKPNPVVFTVKGMLPLSLNQMLRTHPMKRYRLSQEFGMLIKAAATKEDIRCLRAWRDLDYKLSVKVEITNPREFDEDNLSGFGKWGLDQMVMMQWLRNDSPDCVRFEKPSQSKGPKSITFRIAPIRENNEKV